MGVSHGFHVLSKQERASLPPPSVKGGLGERALSVTTTVDCI